MRGFLDDCLRIFRQRGPRASLLGVAAVKALFLAIIVAGWRREATDSADLLWRIILVTSGMAVGLWLAEFQTHPTRILGLIPFGATGLAIALGVAALLGTVPSWLYVFAGVMCGLVRRPLWALEPTGAAGLAVRLIAGTIPAVVAALVMIALGRFSILSAAGQFALLGALTAAGAAVTWRALLRDAYELTLSLLFWPVFRIRGHGPGLEHFPRTGPVLVVANHACWFDPIFLGKFLPRRLIAMLTSDFYDKPILHFLASRVVHCIRVEASGYRREAPELAQAVAALDRGECVLVFPEGQMRKREERPLHRFGRGVWHILHERPNTPVVVCWIEGAWGSYTSYCNGPPTRNKRMDFWRRIDAGVREPEVIDPAILDDHRRTRDYLMRQCLDARRFVGLQPYPESVLQPLEKSPAAADQS